MQPPTDPTRPTGNTDHRMRGSDRAMIAVGSVLIALVVIGVVVGTAQDAQFREDTTSIRPLDVIFLAVGGLLVLVGVIRHAMDRR